MIGKEVSRKMEYSKSRRFFNRKFKISVILLIAEQGSKASEVAWDLDKRPLLISRWKCVLTKNSTHLFLVMGI